MRTIHLRVNGVDACAIEVDDDVYEAQVRAIRERPAVALELAKVMYTAAEIERRSGRLGADEFSTFDGRVGAGLKR